MRREREAPRLPAHPPNLVGSIPLEDLGVLMVDERDTTYTHAVLAAMAEAGAAVVICGRDHLPSAMLLPLSGGSLVLDRLDVQLGVSKPRRKQVWTQVVSAKIEGQAANLGHKRSESEMLRALARSVRSGDPENTEAHAAQRYWPALFEDCPLVQQPFRRRPGDREASVPNNLLDYGYAAVRAALARAIVSAGLLPALGVKHRRRDNAFCLADDLVEPLRPLVDARVRRLALENRVGLDQPTKAELLVLLTAPVRVGEAIGPLYAALPRYVASFIRVLSGAESRLAVPRWWDLPEVVPPPGKDEA